uniref:Uncharacterized protein n=1 Tax=Arundo donax TaxID=35708 RepID=A0A0A9A200_ARUDO
MHLKFQLKIIFVWDKRKRLLMNDHIRYKTIFSDAS